MTQTECVLSELRRNPRRALFITLTCKGDLTAEQAYFGLRNFFRRLKRGGYDVSEYVVGREFQRRGVAHYHILLFTNAYLANDVVIGPAWRLGFTSTKAIDEQRAYYFAFKYLGKGCGATLHSSVAVRSLYNARAVSKWWHKVGACCWRYGIRMAMICERLQDDTAAIAAYSSELWADLWAGGTGFVRFSMEDV